MSEVLTRSTTLTPEEQAQLDDIARNFDHDGVDPFNPDIPDTPAELLPPPVDDGGEEPRPTTSYDVVLVDQSQDARDFARDRADARLTEELNEGGRFKRFAKGIWKGNIARDYYRQKYIREARADIEANQDVLTHEVADADRRGRAIQSTIDRFQSEHDGLIHEEAGENRQELESESGIAQGLKGIIAEYARGGLSDEALQEERTRVIEAYREAHGEEALGEGLVQVDNILTIARSVRGAVEHGESLDNIMRGMRIITGEARTGARTEANYDRVDRVMDRLADSRIGSVVAPEILTAAVTSAASVLRIGSRAAIGAAAMTVIPGLGSGIVAGLRERKRTKDERTQHAREMAQGKQYEDGDERRTEMEATRYETRSATELHDELRSHFSNENLDEGGHEALQVALDALTAAEVRVNYSDRAMIDLVSYSDVALVNEERLKLDIAIAEAKVHANRRLTPEARTALGLEESGTLDEYLDGRANEFYELVDEDISTKDSTARRLELRRSVKAGVIGFGGGLIAGTLAQEIGAMVSDTRAGLVEKLWNADNKLYNGTEHQTLLNGVFGEDKVQAATSGNYNTEIIEGKSTFSVSSEYSIGKNDDGTLSILGSDGGAVSEHLKLNEDGTLTPESMEQLRQHGAVVEDLSFSKETTAIENRTVSVDEFLQNHQDETTRITRDLWYDNNTGAFDRNELGLHWSGAGVDPQGNYQMNVSTMTNLGSSHGGEAVGWASEAQTGNLQLAISATQDSQAEVFMVDINPDGSINIPHDSTAAKFFDTSNGEPIFKGQYAEVVQKSGLDANGVEHVRPLATLVGEGNITSLEDSVETKTTVLEPNYKISLPTHEADTFVEMAPVISVNSRRALGRLVEKSPVRNGYYGYEYGYGTGAEYWTRWKTERSPRLQRDPDADLNTGQELAWYHKQQEKVRGKSYVNEINRYVESDQVLDRLGNETKAIVCIPVAAANESENIYRTLSMFARQDDKDARDSSVVLLNVNWKESLEGDPDQLAKIEKTKAEIERAKADFPEIRIASFEKVWTNEFIAEKEGKIYGEVIKVLYDTAAVALDKANQEGRRDPSTEALLITNDADTEGMSRTYLRNYINTFENSPKNDVFSAMIRRGVSSYKDFPGYGVASEFYAIANMVMLRQQKMGNGGFTTEGPNAGIRMSMYAAMGGVEERVGAGADAVLGQRIAAARREPSNQSRLSRLRGVEPKPGSNRVIGRLVAGAQIDTLPDRLLGAYRQGKWIARGWDNFDSGGYEGREASMAAGTLSSENPETDIDAIAQRIEASVEGFGSNWYRDPGVIASAAALAFGVNNPSEELYTIAWNGPSSNPTSLQFKFTEKGKQQLKERLLKDRSGRRDRFGDRLDRQLYGRNATGSTKRALRTNSRFLA